MCLPTCNSNIVQSRSHKERASTPSKKPPMTDLMQTCHAKNQNSVSAKRVYSGKFSRQKHYRGKSE